MKSPLVKLSLFAVFTFAFVSGLIAYSNSRGNVLPADADEPSWNDGGTDKRFENVFKVTEGGMLKVEADAGTINIESWEKNEVSVVVEIEGSDSRVDKYTVEFKQDGNNVSVIGRVRDRSFFKWHVGNLEAHYTIFVPRKFNSTIESSGGDIDAKNLTGKQHYETSGGNIYLARAEGETYVNTSGGDIEVRDVTGDVDAETSGGNVMCENVVGKVNGHTSGGNVELRSIDGAINAGTSGGNVVIKVTGENKGIIAETSGGDIDIYVMDGIAANIDAETTGGSVDCDLPVTVRGKVRDSELHGKINGGGNPIRAETSGGSIRIALLP